MDTSFSWSYMIELRKKIMQSAMENFSKKGFDRTRMEDIAAAAGLAKGTL
jgi:AcrR family transcriptional regulator